MTQRNTEFSEYIRNRTENRANVKRDASGNVQFKDGGLSTPATVSGVSAQASATLTGTSRGNVFKAKGALTAIGANVGTVALYIMDGTDTITSVTGVTGTTSITTTLTTTQNAPVTPTIKVVATPTAGTGTLNLVGGMNARIVPDDSPTNIAL